ncbi:hypothetical protein GV828_01425 [Flavobacterium sp. NST-5]|uniref:Uncharacterized protein n=1 Tax=Flavobacterium ichthyis TaxID=2698827 RepID=A0ABW9Z5C8_9FLAO|nr:hypothetical protein [Flavobacterium ichthyis]NBL63854.1 hypothetical protein [Flavobacterium ichthyis]
MNKRRLLNLCSVLMVVFLFCCQAEDIAVQQKHYQKQLSVKRLYGQQAKNIVAKFGGNAFLQDAISVQGQKGKSFRTAQTGTVNYDEIIEVIDTLGNTNYTFKIEGHPMQNEKTFYNLVINVNDGYRQAYIVEYAMDEEFALSVSAGQKQMEQFDGVVTIQKIAAGGSGCPDTSVPIKGGGGFSGEQIGGGVNPGSGSGSAKGSNGGNTSNPNDNTNPNNPSSPNDNSDSTSSGPSTPQDPYENNCYVIEMDCYERGMQYWQDEEGCGCIVNPRFMRTGENLVVKDLGNGKDQDPLNPCGGFQLTIGVIDPNLKKNCDELKLNSSSTDFKGKMQTLKDNIDGTVEKTFGIYNGNHMGSSYSNPTCGAILEGNEENAADVPYHISMKATAHNHLTNPTYQHIGTFSPNDIINFSNMIILGEQNLSPTKKEEFAFYLVCSEGNYVLKVTDVDKLYNFAVKYGTNEMFRIEVNDFYKDFDMVHGKEKQKQNLGFLKLLKKYDIGIDYYESDSNYENWGKLELNSAEDNINKKPC